MSKTKKQIVFEAAAELFMEKGYLAASMREIAKNVGLEQASSLVQSFKIEGRVLIKICLENAERLFNGIEAIEKQGPLLLKNSRH